MAKILVIDDEPSVLALLGAFLTGLGHEVISSGSGAAGLAAARESRPPVALVDLQVHRTCEHAAEQGHEDEAHERHAHPHPLPGRFDGRLVVLQVAHGDEVTS